MIRPGDRVRILADSSIGLVTAVVPMGNQSMYKVKIGLYGAKLFDNELEFVSGPIEAGDRVRVTNDGHPFFGQDGLVVYESSDGDVLLDISFDNRCYACLSANDLVRIEEER